MHNLLSKFDKTYEPSLSEVDYLVKSYHLLMSNYGWIPLNEYLELSPELVDALIDMCRKDSEKSNGGINKFR